MPTYGYECTACSDKFETVQSIKDNPLTDCQKCGGTLKKLIYPIGIAFKGSGFYVNDYAPKSSTSASTSSGDTKTETKTEAKAETKSETKPETTKTESTTSTPAATAS